MQTMATFLAQAAQDDPNNGRGLIMRFIIWLVVGVIAGFIGSKIVNGSGEGLGRDLVLGLIGSIVGGLIVHLFGFHRNGSIILSIIVAVIGAILVLVIYHKLIRRTPSSSPRL